MKPRFFISIAAWIFILSSFFSACSDETPLPAPIPDPGTDPISRTVLIYIAADNNLSSFGYNNIDHILTGAAGDNLNGGNLLVYFDPADQEPQLLQFKKGKNGNAVKTVVHTYKEQNSAAPEVLRSVIDEVIEQYPAESYGLVLWSHATAWFPSHIFSMLRSFGADGPNVMEIDQLKEALPDKTFDFILFDACYMASTEVIYALRDKAEYIIGSPVETLATGFPYEKILTPMFKETIDLEGICQAFYDHYKVNTGNSQSASVSLSATAPLSKLTAVVKEIVQGKEEEIYALPVSEMQQLEYLTGSLHALYDFDDYIGRLATPDQYTEFRKYLDEVVLYKQTTPYATFAYGGFSGTQLAMNHFSGLSIYVPQPALSTLNSWYKNTEWYQAVYAE